MMMMMMMMNVCLFVCLSVCLSVRLSEVPIALNSDRSFCPIFLKFEM